MDIFLDDIGFGLNGHVRPIRNLGEFLKKEDAFALAFPYLSSGHGYRLHDPTASFVPFVLLQKYRVFIGEVEGERGVVVL